MGHRRKKKSPAVLSYEFVIQNHADIAIFLVICLLLGFMFEMHLLMTDFCCPFSNVWHSIAHICETIQTTNKSQPSTPSSLLLCSTVSLVPLVPYSYMTYKSDDNSKQFLFYESGPKDIATIFFYMLIAINLHAVIQKYILDKINRYLHLSKTKHSKLNESGQLAIFYLFSCIWGATILIAEEFTINPISLWKYYPHSYMLFQVKFYYICQIAYWLHALLELYFQKVRKEDILRQLCYICLYVIHISGAYILNFQHLGLILMIPHYLVEFSFHASRLFYLSDKNKQKGFTVWALLFIMVRLFTLTLSVLTFGFGLARVENPGFPIAEGNCGVLPVRIGCLSVVCLTQVWMMWKFINFQLKKWREHVKKQIPPPQITPRKNKRTKKKPYRANSVNGAAKLKGGQSLRIRKTKPV